MVSLVVTSKKRISVYLEEDLKKRIERLASARKRSLSNLIESCMEEIVKQAEKDGEIQDNDRP